MKNKIPVTKQKPFWFIKAVFHLYCQKVHGGQQLCVQCEALLRYERERTRDCKYKQVEKSCTECQLQCYADNKRLEINHVIRWSEARISWKQPWLLIRYYLHRLISNA